MHEVKSKHFATSIIFHDHYPIESHNSSLSSITNGTPDSFQG